MEFLKGCDILLKTLIVENNYGIIHRHMDFSEYVIFRDSIDNLIGLRSSNLKFKTISGKTYIEIGFLCEMLLDGNIEANYLLHFSEEDGESEYEWTIFKELKGHTVCGKLIESHLKVSIDHFNNVREVFTPVKKHNRIIRVNYCTKRAYKALLNLKLAIDLIKFGEYRNKENDIQLIAVLEGKLKLRTIKRELNRLKKELEDLHEKSGIPYEPEIEEIREILMEIRKTSI